MFYRLVKELFSFRKKKNNTLNQPYIDLQALNDSATRLMESGDRHSAILAFRKILDHEPENVMAINNLACCLADIGNQVEAARLFATAFSLDDNFLPAIVNHAKLLIDQKHSKDALPFIEHAKHAAPDYPFVHGVYGSLQYNLGNPIVGRQFAMRAWLNQFDNLRLANSYLWYTTYAADAGEAVVASEHAFWAETLRPIEYIEPEPQQKPVALTQKSIQRIRIGYWSPDFRAHSVRYFFRPLLENHDKEKFEIFLYHDFPHQDKQTELIKSKTSHFFDIGSMPDNQVIALIKAHNLDVLVELSGQSSTNRANLLQLRLARLQFSGIGYPPTSGLSTIDGKWHDPHTLTSVASAFYTDRPLVLPQSFWCFDPLEYTPEPSPPPSEFNGYITFGCTGNIAKISDEILTHWRNILRHVSGSRLQIRSISFEDKAAQEKMSERISAVGFNPFDVDLLPPLGGDAFFKSYNDIDVILDTFPFNGGTTTAFALYMGVPVVSIYGSSLTSRMGLSMLTNMGVAQLATNRFEDYIQIAIKTAHDSIFLKSFRETARTKFKTTSLGDGLKFARDFEHICKQALDTDTTTTYRHQVKPLPANELARRAYQVLNSGQHAAAQRIASHCLNHHPNCGAAHIIKSQLFVQAQDYEGGAKYLADQLPNLSASDTPATLVNLLRLSCYRNATSEAHEHLAALSSLPLADPLDRAHLALYQASLATCDDASLSLSIASIKHQIRCTILLVSDNVNHYSQLENHIRQLIAPTSTDAIEFIHCTEREKIPKYQQLLKHSESDFVVFMQSNVIPQHPHFLHRISEALNNADIVAHAGCERWSRLDWRTDKFQHKTGTALWSSADAKDYIEITQWANQSTPIVSGVAILDGKLLAIRLDDQNLPDFDMRLLGFDTLMEEAWTHECFKSGRQLVVHQGLGIHIGSADPVTDYNRSDARWTAAELYDFKAFEESAPDRATVSAPCKDVLHALNILDHLQYNQ